MDCLQLLKETYLPLSEQSLPTVKEVAVASSGSSYSNKSLAGSHKPYTSENANIWLKYSGEKLSLCCKIAQKCKLRKIRPWVNS